MAIVKFQTRFLKTGKILEQVDQRYKRAKNLRPVMPLCASLAQESVRREFIGSYWESPSGSAIDWVPRKDQKTHPLLILSGDLFISWTEGEPVINNKSFSIGSDLEYAAVQRGGTGSDIQQSPLWGNIPPRPHGTRNPRLDEQIREEIFDFIVNGL